jgi:hypothetical protein
VVIHTNFRIGSHCFHTVVNLTIPEAEKLLDCVASVVRSHLAVERGGEDVVSMSRS